jgi:hypothetical protein
VLARFEKGPAIVGVTAFQCRRPGETAFLLHTRCPWSPPRRRDLGGYVWHMSLAGHFCSDPGCVRCPHDATSRIVVTASSRPPAGCIERWGRAALRYPGRAHIAPEVVVGRSRRRLSWTTNPHTRCVRGGRRERGWCVRRSVGVAAPVSSLSCLGLSRLPLRWAGSCYVGSVAPGRSRRREL